MAESFGCCSRWVECSYLGYCTHRSSEAYDGHIRVHDCSLGHNLFLKPKEAFKEEFYKDAKEHVDKGYPVVESTSDREKFEAMLAEYASGSTARTVQVSSGSPWTHLVAGIRIKGEEIWMPKQTVIEQKDGLQLVSWLYKDIVHYGIQETDGGMLEVFTPTPKLRGNALRSYALQTFRTRQVSEYMGKWPSVALDAKSIQEGHVLAYESRPGTVTFALITKKTPSLIMAVTSTGSDSVWLTEKMEGKLQRREVQVIARESVPEKFNTFPTTTTL